LRPNAACLCVLPVADARRQSVVSEQRSHDASGHAGLLATVAPVFICVGRARRSGVPSTPNSSEPPLHRLRLKCTLQSPLTTGPHSSCSRWVLPIVSTFSVDGVRRDDPPWQPRPPSQLRSACDAFAAFYRQARPNQRLRWQMHVSASVRVLAARGWLTHAAAEHLLCTHHRAMALTTRAVLRVCSLSWAQPRSR
jgi:hypothetical protein